MHSDTRAIAWDFDGVLNRNIVNGRFVWADTLEADLGIPLEVFEKGVFDAQFVHMISGKRDLKTHVQDWLDHSGHAVDASTLLDYWFAKDDLKDPYTVELLGQLAERNILQVIATNNETRRSAYIEENAGFGKLVSRVFSSGRIGHAKPDAVFFRHVAEAIGLAPREILLIDDSAANIRSAAALGWQVFHFTEDTRSELASFLGL
ncbi:HAD-IA family hydrolase [uncultured Roseibium sp.]|uniref:HAD-IA family hydrolase n=1 Tax=uncultured Roseibium sp. TaxID=1936171 RepID=UPI0026153122|nr:HAD-IA family hydrolase [uncultured Roseibium sp.]